MPLTPAVRKVWNEHPGYIGAYTINVVTALYLGISAMAMPGRFQAPTYDALRQSLGITTWGVILAAYGLILLASSLMRVAVIKAVFLAGAFMYMLIGIWFASGLGDPHASPWGPIFFAFGVWALTQWVAYRFAEQQIMAREHAVES